MRRHVDRARNKLVPRVRERPSLGADRAGERVEHEESPRHLPPTQVAGSGTAPGVRAKPLARGSDDVGDLLDRRRRNPRLGFGKGEGVRLVEVAKQALELFEATVILSRGVGEGSPPRSLRSFAPLRMSGIYVLLPIPPS